MSTTTQTRNKVVPVRFTQAEYDALKSRAEEEHRPLSNYVGYLAVQTIDETAYLTASPANKATLEKSLANIEAGKIVTKTMEELEALAAE